MLKHTNETPQKPARVVLVGANGFVGSSIASQLKAEGIEVCGITRQEVNLLDHDAAEKLAQYVKPADVLVITSAIVPCKTVDMFADNIAMIKPVCHLIEKHSFSQVVYISSDAVYADDDSLISETSQTTPSSLHGMMHLAREMLLKQSIKGQCPFTILRPSILYGAGDPHNGYGPNRFLRQLQQKDRVVLFGNGEEKRDHVFIGDVAKVVSLVIEHQSDGILNIATGESLSFREVAESLEEAMGVSNQIDPTPRQNPITHRHFDTRHFVKAFPKYRYTAYKQAIKTKLEPASA